MIDANNDGYFEGIDTDKNGTADIAVNQQRFEAFDFITEITNEQSGFGAAADGTLLANNTDEVANSVSGGLNYMTKSGKNGLDLMTIVYNVNNDWFGYIQSINPSSINDGIPDVLLTQSAGPGGDGQQLALLSAANAVVGNGVQWFSSGNPASNVVGVLAEPLNTNGTPNGAFNVERSIQMVALEWSDLGITAGNYNQVDKLIYRLSNTSDVSFLAFNTNSLTQGCKIRDTDNDGIGDYIDLDSDNDGCFDVVEAGFLDADEDGTLGLSTDMSGAVQGSGGYTGTQPNVLDATITHTKCDPDNDLVPGYKDVDDDNDGIVDALEGYSAEEMIASMNYNGSASDVTPLL